MANEIRLRANNISGTTTDNPLTAGAVTINSPGFVDLPVVNTTNHLILIMDPLEVNGQAEIVQVTAHSASATSVTVVRGFDTTTPRQHPLGTTWFHGPVVSDYNYTQRTALSTNRPSSPFTGEQIYETDTKKLMVYNGTDWNPNQAGGQLGYAQVVANQGSITTTVDLTSLTTTVTVGTGRRVKISGQAEASVTVSGQVNFRIIADGSQVQERPFTLNSTGVAYPFFGSFVHTPSAGSHTYKLQMSVDSGGGTATMIAGATLPAFILVEDIGAV